MEEEEERVRSHLTTTYCVEVSCSVLCTQGLLNSGTGFAREINLSSALAKNWDLEQLWKAGVECRAGAVDKTASGHPDTTIAFAMFKSLEPWFAFLKSRRNSTY